MKHGIFYDMTNKEYFDEETHLSSSGLKLLLKEPEMFYRKYILKGLKPEKKECFDVGTAIHTKVLEPHKFDQEIAFFEGKIKRGKAYTDFMEQNQGKLILGNIAFEQVSRMAVSVSQHEKTQELLADPGNSEVSFFTEINNLPVKVRTDRISIERGFILDLKSMSGIINEDTFGKACSHLNYDLSAALYVDSVNKVLEETGNELRIKEFYWPVVSKDLDDIKLFAASEELLEQGRKSYLQAINRYFELSENNWNFKRSVIYLFPKKD